MGSWGDRVSYQGKAVNLGLRYIIDAANIMLARPINGGERGPLTIIQGSWSGASASAGTHRGSSALDISEFNWRHRERIFRLLGVAMWHRPTLPGTWAAHMHGIVDGDGGVSSGAAAQVRAYHNRKNGLANNGPDKGYRMLVYPLYVFPEKPHGRPGKCWVTTAGNTFEQPTPVAPPKRALKVGEPFDVVAVVNVTGTYWGINADAECFPMTSLSRTPVGSKPHLLPAQILDLDRWKVTIPGKDKVREVKQPALATFQDARYFHANEAGDGVVFRTYHGGTTTSGSKNPRSELREMKANGLNEITWDARSGSHRLDVKLAVTHLTRVKPHVVVAQIHGSDDDVTVLRLEGQKLWLTKGDETHGFFLGMYRLGDVIKFSFLVSGGQVRFRYNGNDVQGFSVKAKAGNYFKSGCYLQSNKETAPGESKDAYAEVVVYKVKVTHT